MTDSEVKRKVGGDGEVDDAEGEAGASVMVASVGFGESVGGAVGVSVVSAVDMVGLLCGLCVRRALQGFTFACGWIGMLVLGICVVDV